MRIAVELSRWRLAVCGTLAAPVCLVLTWGVQPRLRGEDRPNTESVSTARLLDDVATRFRENCASCHGNDGAGNARTSSSSVPDFTSVAWQFGQTEDAIIDRMADGVVPLMPSFRDKFSPQEMLEVAVYIRTLLSPPTIDAETSLPKAPQQQGRSPEASLSEARSRDDSSQAATSVVAARIRAGAGIFRESCVACHGADGMGIKSRPQMPGIPDFTNPAWQTRQSDRGLATSIMDGKGSLMPAYRGRITDSQARDIVAYLRFFGPRTAPTKGPGSESELKKSLRALEQRFDELESMLQKNEPQVKQK